jgi:hypothetical protein
MKKRHAPSKYANLTMCGYETTPSEYQSMERRGSKYVSCVKCKQALELRELIGDDNGI